MLNTAYSEGIFSINISCTTDHPSNPGSAHKIQNGALALDINYVNGIHVYPDNYSAQILQNVIGNTHGYKENYGPFIINKVINGKIIKAFWARKYKGGHYDHIHLSIP